MSFPGVEACQAGELDIVLIQHAEAVEVAGLPGFGLAAEVQNGGMAQDPVQVALSAAAQKIGVEIPSVVVPHRVVQLQRALAVQGVQDVRRKLGLEKGKKESLKSVAALLRWADKYQKEDMAEIRRILAQYPEKVISI